MSVLSPCSPFCQAHKRAETRGCALSTFSAAWWLLTGAPLSKYVIWIVAAIVLGSTTARAQTSVAQLADAGWQAVENNDADKAAAFFHEALALRPRSAVLNFGAGVAAHMQGREHDASMLLQKAVELQPDLVQASALLGEIEYHEGELDIAIQTYEAALARAPRNPAMKRRLEEWRSEATTYQQFDTLKDDRFSVMFDGPVERKLASRATTVLGDAFWRIGKQIGAYPSNSINVILYTDKQFRDITGAPEWAGGGFDGQIRMPVKGALQNVQEFDRVLTHELAHAMLKAVAPRNIPVWLNEGLAMHFEGSDATSNERLLAAARIYVPLAALKSSFSRLNSDQANVAYAESLFATGALLERVGAGLPDLLQDLNSGLSIEQAVERYGVTFPDFESELARRVGVRQ
jgi:tetratricopeptide (TPR) repeat protein